MSEKAAPHKGAAFLIALRVVFLPIDMTKLKHHGFSINVALLQEQHCCRQLTLFFNIDTPDFKQAGVYWCGELLKWLILKSFTIASRRIPQLQTPHQDRPFLC
jgi:hypothetical protein